MIERTLTTDGNGLAMLPGPYKSHWFIGLDLGTVQDYSAFAVVEKRIFKGYDNPDLYECRHLERFQIGTPYPSMADRIAMLVRTSPSLASATLVVDGTMAGKSVTNLFLRRAGLKRQITIAITAGLATTAEPTANWWHVPKRELVSVLQMLLQTRRLMIAKELPMAEVLVKELFAFKPKPKTPDNESQLDWREREHDDLVLALAIALWQAEQEFNMSKLLDALIGNGNKPASVLAGADLPVSDVGGVTYSPAYQEYSAYVLRDGHREWVFTTPSRDEAIFAASVAGVAANAQECVPESRQAEIRRIVEDKLANARIPCPAR